MRLGRAAPYLFLLVLLEAASLPTRGQASVPRRVSANRYKTWDSEWGGSDSWAWGDSDSVACGSATGVCLLPDHDCNATCLLYTCTTPLPKVPRDAPPIRPPTCHLAHVVCSLVQALRRHQQAGDSAVEEPTQETQQGDPQQQRQHHLAAGADGNASLLIPLDPLTGHAGAGGVHRGRALQQTCLCRKFTQVGVASDYNYYCFIQSEQGTQGGGVGGMLGEPARWWAPPLPRPYPNAGCS